MTNLSDLLRYDMVLRDVAVPNKKALFQHLSTTVAPMIDIDTRAIVEGLSAREKLGSTGFGAGVAIPHAKLNGLKHVTGIVARLAQPIAYGAVDDLPVDLVFALLSPSGVGAEHLKALARVSRCLRDRAFLDKLRGAASNDALYALLTEHDARDAA